MEDLYGKKFLVKFLRNGLTTNLRFRYFSPMVPLENETNIEVLRSMSLWLRDELSTTTKKLDELLGEQELSKQDWLNAELRDQLSKLQQKFYGFGRESLSKNEERPQGHKDQTLNVHSEPENPSSTADSAKSSKDYPVSDDVVFNYEMSEVELKTESFMRNIPGGSNAWEKVKGLTQDSYEITIVERQIKKVKHCQAKYRLKKAFNKTGKTVLVTAKGPEKVRSGSLYSIDFATHVVLDKYLYHLPLERQRRKFEASGFKVDVKTLYGLCEALSGHCLKVTDKIRKEILSDFTAIHLDETPWRLVGSKESGYMWVLSNRLGSYYQFEPTRSGKVAEEMIRGYQGAIVTDGFSGYNRFKSQSGLRVAHCWSHVRRDFYEIYKNYPEPSKEVLTLIDELFKIESEAKDFEALRILRREKAPELVTKLKEVLFKWKGKSLPRSGLSKAIDYALVRWKELTLFLEDLSVPLSNNDAERSLRHLVMGRKNFSGSKTINGADVAVNLYTVIESAKKAGLQPEVYLKYLIRSCWRRENPQTPLEFMRSRLEKKPRVSIPEKNDWKI